MNGIESQNRRSFLRGLGTAVALPFLSSAPAARLLGAGAAAAKAPLRMAFVYIPNGVNPEGWQIPTEGALPAKLPDDEVNPANQPPQSTGEKALVLDHLSARRLLAELRPINGVKL